MTLFSRVLLALAWAVSLLVVAAWSSEAQEPMAPGVEVRFIPSDGRPGAPHGALVARVNGQWLPVTVDVLPQPDVNSLLP